MLRFARYFILRLLLTSCVTRYVKTEPPPCKLPAWPEAYWNICSDTDIPCNIAMAGLYIRDAEAVFEKLETCRVEWSKREEDSSTP